MTAILDPATLSDVECYAGPSMWVYETTEAATAYLDAIGKHLEAAAGRARNGAYWASVVARRKRVDREAEETP